MSFSRTQGRPLGRFRFGVSPVCAGHLPCTPRESSSPGVRARSPPPSLDFSEIGWVWVTRALSVRFWPFLFFLRVRSERERERARCLSPRARTIRGVRGLECKQVQVADWAKAGVPWIEGETCAGLKGRAGDCVLQQSTYIILENMVQTPVFRCRTSSSGPPFVIGTSILEFFHFSVRVCVLLLLQISA